MSKYSIDNTTLTAIADAIRKKIGTDDPILTEGMAAAIAKIEEADSEIYTGTITFANDTFSWGVEVNDASIHIPEEVPKCAVCINLTNFAPGEYVTAQGAINGILFRHVGDVRNDYRIYEEYIRGQFPISYLVCKFYGGKTWFYSNNVNEATGVMDGTTTEYTLFKSGDTYLYYIEY